MYTLSDLRDGMRRRIRAEYDELRRQARGVRQDAPVSRRYGAIYAELARIDADEAAALARLDADLGPVPTPRGKPGRKPDPQVSAATAEARAAIAASVTRKRAVADAAERHGVNANTVDRRLRRDREDK